MVFRGSGLPLHRRQHDRRGECNHHRNRLLRTGTQPPRVLRLHQISTPRRKDAKLPPLHHEHRRSLLLEHSTHSRPDARPELKRSRCASHNEQMNLKAPFDRITIEPGKMGGRPCIRGMRITVRRVLEILATYPERSELFKDYPDLQEVDLQQALEFAAATVDGTIDLHLDAA